MNENDNDHDRLAAQMQAALSAFLQGMHEPVRWKDSDSITIRKDDALSGIIQLHRAIAWCQGLAESHRNATACTTLDEDTTETLP